jgi:hypothetical protein
MTSPDSNIDIVVRFTEATHYPTSVITKVLDRIEKAVYQEELAILKEARGEAPQGSEVIIDAVAHRIKKFKGSSVSYVTASTGSIVMGGIATGITLWLLEKTIGESLREGWVQSNAHDALVSVIRTALDRKAERICDRLNNSKIALPHHPQRIRASLSLGDQGRQRIEVSAVRIDVPPDRKQGSH